MQPQVWDEARQALDDMDFPASKEEVVAHAAGRGERDDVVRMLQALPQGTYDNIEHVRRAVRISPSASEGQGVSQKAAKVRSPHSHRIAEHMRDTSQT
ncbi:MAG: DUF2795 domain-containing protein [Micromonosporaceae bacterium]|nr:DUF2795 domain-containing protein [Micromonosporaceae bacterium]